MGLLNCKNNTTKIDRTTPKLFSITLNTGLSKTVDNEAYSYYILSLPKFMLSIYDVGLNKTSQLMLDIPLITSLDGISQVSLNQTIYLCGHNKQVFSGSSSSFLFKVLPFNPVNQLYEVLLSSLHHHYSPSLVSVRDDIIVVIGGYRQTLCESYSITQEKWKEIASLPDERYQPGVLVDLGENWIYLFGGYNDAYKKNSSNILKCESRYFFQWETILLKEGEELVAKSSFGLFNSDNQNVMVIVGGKKVDGTECDEIIQFDIIKRKASVMKQQLPKTAIFPRSEKLAWNNAKVLLIDSNQVVYSIDISSMAILSSFNLKDQYKK